MTDSKRRRFPIIALLPLVIFAAFAAVAYGLLTDPDRNASEIPSALIAKPAPDFDLPPVEGLARAGQPVPGFSRADLAGGVTLVNVFASWCGPCRDEHPYLMRLAEDDRFRILGLNYKDDAENATRFLNALGNPYEAVGADRNGRVGIDWGVYGVPETFVVGADGTILFKYVGPIDPTGLERRLMPAIEQALAAAPAASPAAPADAPGS